MRRQECADLWGSCGVPFGTFCDRLQREKVGKALYNHPSQLGSEKVSFFFIVVVAGVGAYVHVCVIVVHLDFFSPFTTFILCG